jgi:hypothetical protein
VRLHEGQRDVLRVLPVHFGISTTTFPFTMA